MSYRTKEIDTMKTHSKLVLAGLLILGSCFTMGAANAITLNATDDSYTSSRVPDGNFGFRMRIRVTQKDEEVHANGLVRFDLTPLLPAVTAEDIQKATLRIFAAKSAHEGDVKVYALTEAWEEGTVTDNPFPALGDFIDTIHVSPDDTENFQYNQA